MNDEIQSMYKMKNPLTFFPKLALALKEFSGHVWASVLGKIFGPLYILFLVAAFLIPHKYYVTQFIISDFRMLFIFLAGFGGQRHARQEWMAEIAALRRSVPRITVHTAIFPMPPRNTPLN